MRDITDPKCDVEALFKSCLRYVIINREFRIVRGIWVFDLLSITLWAAERDGLSGENLYSAAQLVRAWEACGFVRERTVVNGYEPLGKYAEIARKVTELKEDQVAMGLTATAELKGGHKVDVPDEESNRTETDPGEANHPTAY